MMSMTFWTWSINSRGSSSDLDPKKDGGFIWVKSRILAAAELDTGLDKITVLNLMEPSEFRTVTELTVSDSPAELGSNMCPDWKGVNTVPPVKTAKKIDVASDEEIERLSVDVDSDSLRLLPSILIDIIVDSIQKFGPSAFFHNTDLCDNFLEVSCSAGGTTFAKRKPKLSVLAIVAIFAAAVILSSVCLITIINMKARRKRRREDETFIIESTSLASTDSNATIGKLVFSKTLPSIYEELEAGTKSLLEKESLISGSTIGSVYRTSFEGGVSIAVKKHIETCAEQTNISNNLHLMFIIRV
ncbi:hypothetical protein FXO38_30592 [Capsicum annuum]|uniref:Uncharacterized protein n=1 Tax=Capsicum annuum TaxID=4072 RepID=A0A2G2Y816_CAPAN|nr:hypothetical protein FXO38_30592 [Capsicum annuum]KAF3676102.1 hypothetical protein FXO37_05492 [Capsicum annuum]PHT65880.1 hypothetical protein T459_30305 [Capsicum annuum]